MRRYPALASGRDLRDVPGSFIRAETVRLTPSDSDAVEASMGSLGQKEVNKP
jgi:hypothetical protein